MMFLKAVFTLYFAAVTLAAPGLVELSDVGMSRMNPSSLCASLVESM